MAPQHVTVVVDLDLSGRRRDRVAALAVGALWGMVWTRVVLGDWLEAGVDAVGLALALAWWWHVSRRWRAVRRTAHRVMEAGDRGWRAGRCDD